jgi:hypothetical protein
MGRFSRGQVVLERPAFKLRQLLTHAVGTVVPNRPRTPGDQPTPTRFANPLRQPASPTASPNRFANRFANPLRQPASPRLRRSRGYAGREATQVERLRPGRRKKSLNWQSRPLREGGRRHNPTGPRENQFSVFSCIWRLRKFLNRQLAGIKLGGLFTFGNFVPGDGLALEVGRFPGQEGQVMRVGTRLDGGL